MKMGIAEKQNIAIQHAYFNRHGGRRAQRPIPMSFREWLLNGMKRYHEEKGFAFELVTPSLMRIKRPGQPNLLRTCADFAREYREEYLSKF